MIEQDQLEAIHESGMAFKTHMWKAHGERNSTPRIGVCFRGIDELMEVDSDAIKTYMSDGGRLGDAIRMMSETMPDHLRSDLDQLWLVMDAYMQTGVESEDDIPDHGDLHESFVKDPFSTVKECLITLVASDDRCGGCDIQSIRHVYAITDGGVIEWGDKSFDTDQGGDVSDAIHELFKRELL